MKMDRDKVRAWKQLLKRHGPPSLTTRAVAYAIYDYVDWETGNGAHPSDETLARDLASSTRTISRHREILVEQGWLFAWKEKGAGGNLKYHYSLAMPPDTESPDTESPDTESPDTESPDHLTLSQGLPDTESPYHIKDHIKDHIKKERDRTVEVRSPLQATSPPDSRPPLLDDQESGEDCPTDATGSTESASSAPCVSTAGQDDEGDERGTQTPEREQTFGEVVRQMMQRHGVTFGDQYIAAALRNMLSLGYSRTERQLYVTDRLLEMSGRGLDGYQAGRYFAAAADLSEWLEACRGGRPLTVKIEESNPAPTREPLPEFDPDDSDPWGAPTEIGSPLDDPDPWGDDEEGVGGEDIPQGKGEWW